VAKLGAATVSAMEVIAAFDSHEGQ